MVNHQLPPYILTQVAGLSALLIALVAYRRNLKCDGGADTYRQTLAVAGSLWPWFYYHLFPTLAHESSPKMFLVGAVLPSFYLTYLSSTLDLDEKRQSFENSFSKEVIVSTSVLLLNVMSRASKTEQNALRICLSIALLSSFVDADENKKLPTARNALAMVMRSVSLFAAVSVMVSPNLSN